MELRPSVPVAGGGGGGVLCLDLPGYRVEEFHTAESRDGACLHAIWTCQHVSVAAAQQIYVSFRSLAVGWGSGPFYGNA